MPKPTMLMIMDGWGWREEREGNAVLLAQTPNFDRLWAECPHAFLRTSGADVGLPDGQMGNSEVGHLNIGAGRVVLQELPRIDEAIKTGDLEKRIADSGLIGRVGSNVVHLIGLVSPGGVHSHERHLAAVGTILAAKGVKVAVHAITDGRDTAPDAAAGFVETLERTLPAEAQIATVIGRYYAMDRDKRWERTKAAFDAIVFAEGASADTAQTAIRAAYDNGHTDEFIPATVINGYQGMRDGDAVLCINFRSDRVREILSAILLADFDGFDRGKPPMVSAAVGMVSYGTALEPVMRPLFPPHTLSDGLSETVAEAGLQQIHLAETEKYPHVTYFLNGGREEPFANEERVMIASPKVATYDLQPEMSAPELTRAVLDAIESDRYSLIVVNYANPDMVGHTGSLDAAIKAVETVDDALGQISDAIARRHGALLVTADHGNCETMIDPDTGGPHTAHTLNVVPVVLQSDAATALSDGRLADLAPTLLDLMGLDQPPGMTGRSLIGHD